MTARRTRQRDVLEQVVRRAARPLSVEEIHLGGREELPKLGIATVYRFVKSEVEAGTLAAVELPGADTRYEVAGLHHHHHFRCDDCGKVFDLPGCTSMIDGKAPENFEVRGHEVVLFGACAECVA